MYTFLDTFDVTYKRSQTESTRKILRCFPKCRSLGHRANGFCGSTVRVEGFRVDEGIHFWATFTSVNQDPFKQGDYLSPGYFDNKNIGEKSTNIVWYEGIVTRLSDSVGHIIVEFNPINASWLYSWFSSHRSRSNNYHTFIVSGCKQTPDGRWRVETVQHSKSFQVHTKSIFGKKRASENEQNTLTTDENQFESKKTKTKPSPQDFQESKELVFVSIPETDDEEREEFQKHYATLSTLSSLGRSIQNIMRNGLTPSSDTQFSLLDCNLSEEQKMNVTLDRIGSLFDNPEQFQNKITTRAFNNTLVSRCWNAQVDAIEDIFDDVFIFIRHNKEFDQMVDEWADPRKSAEFKILCEREMDLSFEWTIERELETFDPQLGLEKSFFAEFREAYRSVFRKAIIMRNMHPLDFFDFMQFLSEEGLLYRDPFHPPPHAEALNIHLQIYGTSQFYPANYDTGRSCFSSLKVLAHYAKSLLLARRSDFQVFMSNAIHAKSIRQAICKLPVIHGLASSMDLTGEWIERTTNSNNKLGFYGVIGKLAGVTMNRILRFLVGKLVMEHTSNSLIVKTRPVLSFCWKYAYCSDGNFHPHVPNHPISQFASVSKDKSKGKNRQYAVFVDQETKTTCVYIDFDLPFTREMILQWYPNFIATSQSNSFRFYRMQTFRKIDHNELQIGIYDYFIPVEVNSLSVPFAKALYQTSMNQCAYLAELCNISYIRFIMGSEINRDVVDLLV